MKRLIKLLTINREFIFRGQLEDLNHVLKESESLKYGMNSKREVEFSPAISIGTMWPFGIEVKAFINDMDSDRLKIRLKTNIRPEHYFLILFNVFFLYASFTDNDSNPEALPVVIEFVLKIFIWILCHLISQFFCRLQENELIEKIIRKLRLKEI